MRSFIALGWSLLELVLAEETKAGGAKRIAKKIRPQQPVYCDGSLYVNASHVSTYTTALTKRHKRKVNSAVSQRWLCFISALRCMREPAITHWTTGRKLKHKRPVSFLLLYFPVRLARSKRVVYCKRKILMSVSKHVSEGWYWKRCWSSKLICRRLWRDISFFSCRIHRKVSYARMLVNDYPVKRKRRVSYFLIVFDLIN